MRIDIDEVILEINKNLEEIAKHVLAQEIEKESNALFRAYNYQFFREIDTPQQHQPRWHQWGIVTHTRKFIEMYDNEVKIHLEEWNREEVINQKLAETIDAVPKSKLLYIGILLHDIGKFQKNYTQRPNLTVFGGFKHHERYSQHIINNELYPLLHEHYGLSKKQIEYIGRCARYHFELGFVREWAKQSEQGYTLEFVHSKAFKKLILNRISDFQGYIVEVGILFLADSYAKTDIEYKNRSEEEILDELDTKGLERRLLASIQQKPINIEIVKEYFSIVYGEDMKQLHGK
jgi:hypothetical protein